MVPQLFSPSLRTLSGPGDGINFPSAIPMKTLSVDKQIMPRKKYPWTLLKQIKAIVINVKTILAVIIAAYAVAKRKPEKIRIAGIRTLTSAIPVQRSNQLSYQANWELVIKLVRNIPGKDEDEIMNI